MAQWAKTQTLQGDGLQQVHKLYGKDFPLEVRHFMAPWIEENLLEMHNYLHDEQYALLFSVFIQELEAKANSLVNEALFISKLKLQEAASMFRIRFGSNPWKLFKLIKYCLGKEERLIYQFQSTVREINLAAHMGSGTGTTLEIFHQLEVFRSRTQETGKDLRALEQEVEAYIIQYHSRQQLTASVSHYQTGAQTLKNIEAEKKCQQKESLDTQLTLKLESLVQQHSAITDKLKETVSHLATLQSRIVDDELSRWKQQQQRAGNGGLFHSSLDLIQEWCESLAESIWLNRQHIKEAERLGITLRPCQSCQAYILAKLEVEISQLLYSLVTSTFIIEKQPPQVIKTNTRFTSTVRLLVGGKLSVHMNPPHVKVTINNETQTNTLLNTGKIREWDNGSGDILNNNGYMEYQHTARQLSIDFRNMMLKNIKRTEKKETESVTDEKFCLLFTSQFSIGWGKLHFQVLTLSVPVVVIVLGTEEPQAWGTVTWDNAFSEPGRLPFAVPDKVPWHQVAEALNMKFTSATGKPLSDDHLRFMAEKAFRVHGDVPSNIDYRNQLLSWSQFNKDHLLGSGFTFWEWFYAVMKNTREYLKGLWTDGCILGFIHKKQAEEMLSTCPTGTFLLRFSDSELGGVTIAWINEAAKVCMLQPLTAKDFAICSLADRIKESGHLQTLYPDIRKKTVFRKYYTSFTENEHVLNNGSVTPLLVTHIPDLDKLQAGSMISYPKNTLQSVFQPQSPDNVSVTSDSESSSQDQYSQSEL